MLAGLSEAQRTPIELACFASLTSREIADITGIAAHTLRALIRDGLMDLGSRGNDLLPNSGAPPNAVTGALAEEIRDRYQTGIGIEQAKGRLPQQAGDQADHVASDTTRP